MSDRRQRRVGVALAAVGLLLAACAVPIPGDRSRARDNLDDPATTTWRPGTTLRQEVLLALGDPDDLAPDERWLAWEDYRSSGHVILIFGPGDLGTYGTDDVLHFRRRYVFYDGNGRFQATHVDAGSCALPPPCRAASEPERPENLLIDAALGPLIVEGEQVYERLHGAVRAVGGGWMPGVVVFTSKALVFVDRLDGWPRYRPELRLAYAELGVLERLDLPGAPAGAVSLARRDGSRESIAFKPHPFTAPQDAPPFDPGRAQVLLDAVRALRP